MRDRKITLGYVFLGRSVRDREKKHLKISKEEAEKRYLEACRHGTRKIYHARLMFVGHYNAGKTRLRKQLLGQDYAEGSTVGIEIDPHACTVEVDEAVNWIPRKEGKLPLSCHT